MADTLQITERVVEAVADHANTDPVELPALYEILDPDALDALIETMTDGEVSFQYAGHTVIVDSRGTIETTGPLAAD